MAKMIRFACIFVWLLTTNACSTSAFSPKWERNFAQRFVDADTNLPIEGVYVNVLWTRAFPGKVGSECMQATLIRSGADGWARFTAPEDKSATRRPERILAPNYEYMAYTRPNYSDKGISEVVLNRLEAFRIAPAYPAWISSIEAMGYRMENEHYVKEFTLQKHPDPKVEAATVRLITRRSFPPGMRSATLGVSGGCEDKSRNVGLLPTHAKYATWLHQRENIKMLCDERWDTAKSAEPGLLTSVLSFPDKQLQTSVFEKFSAEFPENVKERFEYQKPFSKTERERFCSWIVQFVPQL